MKTIKEVLFKKTALVSLLNNQIESFRWEDKGVVVELVGTRKEDQFIKLYVSIETEDN